MSDKVYTVRLPETLVKRVEEFAHAHDGMSRSEAVRLLVVEGLKGLSDEEFGQIPQWEEL